MFEKSLLSDFLVVAMLPMLAYMKGPDFLVSSQMKNSWLSCKQANFATYQGKTFLQRLSLNRDCIHGRRRRRY